MDTQIKELHKISADVFETMITLSLLHEREQIALMVEKMGAEGYGTLAIAAAIRMRHKNEQIAA